MPCWGDNNFDGFVFDRFVRNQIPGGDEQINQPRGFTNGIKTAGNSWSMLS